MKHISTLALALIFALLLSCRTLDPQAASVLVSDKSFDGCKNLGVVNVNWSWWGAAEERINAMRNQVAKLGGNTLVMTGDEAGIAYSCPAR